MSSCPILRCRAPIPAHHVMCRDHWYQVPAALRRRVNEAYRTAPRSEEHYAAVADAITAVMEKEQ